MRTWISVLVISVLFFLSGPLKAQDATAGIDYITEEYPPYNFKDASGEITGLSVDILSEMFKVMSSSNTASDIKLRPWARGYRDAQKPGLKNVLFSTTRSDSRENLFKWVGPISSAVNAIFTLKGNPSGISLNSDADFARYKYGVIRDDIAELILKEKGVPKNKLSLSTNFESLLKQLNRKRVQAIAYNKNVGVWLIKKLGYSPDDYDVVYESKTGELYFAFNKTIDDAVVKAHQQALDQVFANKVTINAIKDKYLK